MVHAPSFVVSDRGACATSTRANDLAARAESAPAGDRGPLAGGGRAFPGESLESNPTPAINTCPVNSGCSLDPQGLGIIFPLGNPLGLTDSWHHRRHETTPVFSPFPPYLVFDSETRTNPCRARWSRPSF